ncbi:crotonyl-CoA carboxylase/reductase [Streptomyces anulatus]|uniref:crotonyl-CoA carboxylase/reductase n=1 Tax=Streptomyces anulatus TaxID=1892 RepID=UPI00386AA363|nr:crotonyl-CoA carboxylase/reductase [Streptomyces anulatus]WTE07644.1 crotonyl-CoA carboxylase/reductase [Streptomyces anulatus]
MRSIPDALLGGATPQEIAAIELPGEYRAAYIRAEDVDMFDGVPDRDVRKSIHVGEVPMPDLAPDEVVVAVMACAVNYNTIWSAMFQPMPTFKFLERLARQGGWAERHNLPYQVVGSDASGVVVRVGSGVRRWKPGDHIVVHPAHVDDQEPGSHADGMLGSEQRAWGYETNFGAMADYCVVRASQLVPKPPVLTWEEAAANTLCASTAYRMLVGEHGARIKQGDIVLVWGATGGLGGYAVQMAKNGGAIPVGIVGSQEKAEAARRLGCDIVITREEIGLDHDPTDDPRQVMAIGRRLGQLVRERAGRDPDVVFEHVGRATFGISVFVARRGGTVVTCGSSTGYQHVYDNRYLWMQLKRIIGSHGANLQEAWECNRLFEAGRIVPTLSALYPLKAVADACRVVQKNQHIGKVAVLCMAPEPGLGCTDPELRARIGEEHLNPLAGLTPSHPEHGLRLT